MKESQRSHLGKFVLTAAAFVLAIPLIQAQTTNSNNQPAPSGLSVSEQLVGSWRLVSRESKKENGEVVPDPGLATVPLGILIYDRSGHVAAQLSRKDRTVSILADECQAAATTKGTPDTAQTIFGYDAYFGTYKVNEREGIVTHHLEAAIFPGDVGKDIERHFAISGDQLTITFNTTTRESVRVTRTLKWERLK
jgi:hypothetical protein